MYVCCVVCRATLKYVYGLDKNHMSQGMEQQFLNIFNNFFFVSHSFAVACETKLCAPRPQLRVLRNRKHGAAKTSVPIIDLVPMNASR